MNKKFKQYLQLLLVSMDWLLLSFSFGWANYLSVSIYKISSGPAFSYWFFINVLWFVTAILIGCYNEKSILHFETFIKRTTQVFILWTVLTLIYIYLNNLYDSLQLIVFGFILSFAFSLMLNRFLYIGIRNYFKEKDYLFNRALILGYNDTAVKLSSYIEEESVNVNLLGFAEDKINIKELTRYPILSDIDNVIEIAKKMDVQEIFSTITPEQNKSIYTLMSEAEKECIRFKIVPDLSTAFSKPVVVDYIRDLPILSLRSEPLEDVGNRIKKRLLDLAVSSLVIVCILSWLIPVLGLLIVLESSGPVFFRQRRTGKNNHTFNCLKFRSMVQNNEADSKQATQQDGRTTKIGKIIRKTSLDEFPQFINVFRGEMSLVGPRPHMLKHTDEFSKVVNEFMVRHFTKPGITGWAQINGLRGEIKDPHQLKMRVNSDLWYQENWSIWLDIKILFLTIYKVFEGDKMAY